MAVKSSVAKASKSTAAELHIVSESEVAEAVDLTASRIKLAQLVKQLNEVFLERSALINGLLTAYVAGTNLFVGGAPGTGKTALGKAVSAAFDTRSFYYLMSSMTQPDEILGSVDLAELQHNSEFKRDLDGKLADVELAILDEGFKANSPCLNALLGLILDKEIVNGKQTIKVPLVSMLVASNELPQEDVLAPFWDRLPLRFWVENCNARNTKKLLMRRAGLEKQPKITVQLSLAELKLFQEAAKQVQFSEDVVDLLLEISKRLAEQGIKPSTRKFEQLIDILKAYAFVTGKDEVSDEHLSMVANVLWEEPQQQSDIETIVNQTIQAATEGLNQIKLEAEQIVAKLSEMAAGGDAIRRKVSLHAANSKLCEMEAALDGMITSSAPGSRKHKIALENKQSIQLLREQKILKPLAALEF